DFTLEQQYVIQRYEETGEPVVCTIDSETWGLNPYNPERHIVSVQLTVKPEHTAIVTFKDVEAMKTFNGHPLLGAQIQWFLTSPYVIMRAANGKYDMNWFFLKWDFECTNFMMDTT